MRQVGFCLVCGNGVDSDQEFFETDGGVCHGDCIERHEARA